MKIKLLFTTVFLIVFAFSAFAGEHNKDNTKNFSEKRRATFSYYDLKAPVVNHDQVLSSLSESFEGTFPPTGWTKLDPDAGTGWDKITSGGAIPGWNGVIASCPPGGGTAITYATYTNGGGVSNDMWLITPQITNILLTDSLYFYVKKWPGIQYADTMDVKISNTTNSTTSAFTFVVALLGYPGVNDTTWTQKRYMFGNVSGLATGNNIYIAFREHVVDNIGDGDVMAIDLVQVTSGVVGIHQIGSQVPKDYSLSQNYPNPFNPSTNLNFGIPKSGNVKIAVYDILGREAALVLNEYKEAGSYKLNFDASKLTSGIYFYKITSNNFTETKKMMLVK